MRKQLILLFLLGVFGLSFAEERRLLTMEDAILNRNLTPKNYQVRWSSDYLNQYLHKEDTVWYAIDVRTGKQRVVDYVEPIKKHVPHAVLKENNIVWLTEDSVEIPITSFEDKNIVCGREVSRNEFGCMHGLFPSPDNSRLAFYVKDESQVTTFPLLDITTRTGTANEIKYPMVGMSSERLRLGVYDVAQNKTIYLNITDFTDERYLTNVTWSPDSKTIYIQVMNREQKELNLNAYDALTGEFKATLLSEKNDQFLEPNKPLIFIDDDRFVYTTDNRDGYYNLYLYSLKKQQLTRLTCVDADVEYLDHDNKYVYYYSAEVSSAERHLCRVNITTGKSVCLTRAEGWHQCQLSTDKRYFTDNYSSLNVPRVVAVGSTDGKFYREVFKAEDPCKDYNFAPIELGTIKSADGKYDNNYRLIRPLDFDSTEQYPVILYVYGGPHTQLVRNSYQGYLRRWEMYMAQRGYVVFVMDNRGTPNHGADYARAIHRQCGVAEMQDQMVGMKWLMSHSWVDKNRIGVHGWSYGGFMTISLMTNYPEIFKVGVAGGPVIDWKWYEVMYGERYMETPETNAEGFEAVSLMNKAKDLKGKLLICQGLIDNVVLYQHSLNFLDACITNNISIDYFIYPRAEHNVIGKDRVHLMQKVTDYFEDYLK
ncbi:MAG: DPP IV N-terminal domain-containing protein [Paludibacteraceae bacterium]|nr:DPP IV N-terminal domain-containing protein [Paludibacteraceae bacterium]